MVKGGGAALEGIKAGLGVKVVEVTGGGGGGAKAAAAAATLPGGYCRVGGGAALVDAALVEEVLVLVAVVMDGYRAAGAGAAPEASVAGVSDCPSARPLVGALLFEGGGGGGGPDCCRSVEVIRRVVSVASVPLLFGTGIRCR